MTTLCLRACGLAAPAEWQQHQSSVPGSPSSLCAGGAYGQVRLMGAPSRLLGGRGRRPNWAQETSSLPRFPRLNGAGRQGPLARLPRPRQCGITMLGGLGGAGRGRAAQASGLVQGLGGPPWPRPLRAAPPAPKQVRQSAKGWGQGARAAAGPMQFGTLKCPREPPCPQFFHPPGLSPRPAPPLAHTRSLPAPPSARLFCGGHSPRARWSRQCVHPPQGTPRRPGSARPRRGATR